MSEPLVSVFMPVYNHGKFVGEAIEGVMAQKTDFPLELIICDDFSIDGSREVIDEMALKHPNIVKIYQPHNTRGVRNMMQGLAAVRGKYLAMCEGDDFWTDPEKLQKQVSFLKENPEFTVSTHKVSILYTDAPSNHSFPQYIYKDCTVDEQRVRDGIFYADEIVDNYYMHTSSMVFRWKFREGIPEYFRMRMLLDHFLLLIHAADGKIKYFDTPMSVWRRHVNSYSYAQLHDKGLFFQKEGDDWLKCYREIDSYFHGRFHYQIRERMLLALRALTDHCMSTGQYDQLKELYQKNWDVIRKPVLENEVITKAVRTLFPDKREFHPAWTTALSSESDQISVPMKPELDLELLDVKGESLWEHWTRGREHSDFAGPWSAITAYALYHGLNTIWLPTACPANIIKMFEELQIVRKFYPVGLGLDIDPAFLSLAKKSDLIVTLDWFGKTVSEELSRALHDSHWIDMRRSPDFSPEAKITVFDCSWFGAPDGAIMVGKGMSEIRPALLASPSHPLASNFIEQRERELATQLPGGAASKLSLDIIRRTPVDAILNGRHRHLKRLQEKFGGMAFLEDLDAPWAFPIRTPPGKLVSALVGSLVREGIDARRLWLSNLTAADCFARRIMDTLVMIPCQHGLDEMQMDRLISAMEDVLENRNNALNASGRSRQ